MYSSEQNNADVQFNAGDSYGDEKGFINDIKLVRVNYSLLIVMMGKHIVRWWLQQNPIQPLIFRQMTQCLQVAEMK